MFFRRRCPRCAKKALRGRGDKVVIDGMKQGLMVNPEWLWSECRKCGGRFKERHYGDGTLIPVDQAEWDSRVVK